MTKIAALLSIAFVMGCEDNSEVNSLRREVEILRSENAEMRTLLPSEKPKVVKDLDEAVKANEILRREINGLQHTLDVKASEIPKEMLPFSKMLMDLQKRLEELEKTASRKGHTHEYEDSCPIGTFNTRTKSTGAEK